jgi:hypothetical protein
MRASQGYSQSVRALYVAESGLARFFAMSPMAGSDSTSFEFYNNPCADSIAYPTQAEQDACVAEGDDDEVDLLEEFSIIPPPPVKFALQGANVYLTSDFVLSDGQRPIYRVRSEARVDDLSDPSLYTVRVVDTYAWLSPPFEITTTFAAAGGVDFGGVDEHYHFDSKAKAGKTGDCGSEVLLPDLQIPSGQFSLPLPHADCPAGLGCPYKWHMKGGGIDSTYAVGSQIVDQMGLDWGSFLSDSLFDGVPGVILLDDSEDFEDLFVKSKDKDKAYKGATSWPITRYTGDLSTDQEVKGYGLLIVDGDLFVTDHKLEWVGLILVGGTISTVNSGGFKVSGAAAAGLGCTDAEIAAGLCRSSFMGESNEFKYRPCELNQAWNSFMRLRPLDDLFREASPSG